MTLYVIIGIIIGFVIGFAIFLLGVRTGRNLKWDE